MSEKSQSKALPKKGKAGGKKPRVIPPGEYNRLLDGLQLKTVTTTKLYAELRDESQLLSGVISASVKDQPTLIKLEDDYVVLKMSYDLSVRAQRARKIAIKIQCEYTVGLESENKLSRSFCDMYAKRTLPFTTWPFFRECVNSATARMNIPPITLPLIKGPGVKSKK